MQHEMILLFLFKVVDWLRSCSEKYLAIVAALTGSTKINGLALQLLRQGFSRADQHIIPRNNINHVEYRSLCLIASRMVSEKIYFCLSRLIDAVLPNDKIIRLSNSVVNYLSVLSCSVYINGKFRTMAYLLLLLERRY